MCNIVKNQALNKEFFYCREHKKEAPSVTSCEVVPLGQVSRDIKVNVKSDFSMMSNPFILGGLTVTPTPATTRIQFNVGDILYYPNTSVQYEIINLNGNNVVVKVIASTMPVLVGMISTYPRQSFERDINNNSCIKFDQLSKGLPVINP